MSVRRSYSQAHHTQPVRVLSAPPTGYRPVARRPAPQRTNPAYPPAPQRYPTGAYPMPPARQRMEKQAARQTARKSSRLWLWVAAGSAFMMFMTCGALTLGLGLVYANGILPGVQAGGVGLGGLSEAEAAQKLADKWQQITLTDGQRAWRYAPASFGITLDARATARAAYEQGRSNLNTVLGGLIGHVETPPVVTIDAAVLESALQSNTNVFGQDPVNAGVQFVNGQVETTSPHNGKAVDVGATVARAMQNPGAALRDGRLELVMQAVQPAISDSTPMLEQARALLSSPLDIRIFDPVTGDSVYWSAPPTVWANWLSAEPDPSSATGLAITANDAPVRDYLTAQSAVLDSTRYLKLDEAVASVQQGIREGRTSPYARVYHHDWQYVVKPGETITSIAWDVGVPYLYIVQANGGLQSVSAGQTITIPSADTFMPYPVDPDKRIVVSISQQHTWVYENGQEKWSWATSTGIPDSPTWPGIYQIISHETNAYAGNWDLWMPNFMGVYQPIPGADFTNGFHGFPTRGGWQLLWTNSLGTRVTYGCILLSNDNVQLLYNWAEEGVVVEIQA
ncbi:MAG: L,D-transpeptidase family protein [Anaerolineae bacterium]